MILNGWSLNVLKRILLSVVFEEGNFSFAGEVYNSYRM